VIKSGRVPSKTLALGAHLKNTIALSVDRQIIVSQHIGDMSTRAAFSAFERITSDLQNLYGVTPEQVACDAHPDYLTTRYAGTLDLPRRKIQHHYAHAFACMAENELEPPVLGVSWDGTGFGEDGTVWGGEFLALGRDSVERAGHLRTFPLPGGEQAVREPRHAAVGLLYEIFSDAAFAMDNVPPIRTFSEKDRGILRTMLQKRLNSPVTSSAGRLFDAVASLLDLRHRLNYEGQAAMELEFAAAETGTDEIYPLDIARENGVFVIDWEPMIRTILSPAGESRRAPLGGISARFHNTLAEIIVEMARKTGERRVVLSGGCFQNRYLTEATIARLRRAGFTPYWHQRIPPNDGGIALGQIAAMMYLNNGG
jgi:hydrogenase maturation protein HypF